MASLLSVNLPPTGYKQIQSSVPGWWCDHAASWLREIAQSAVTSGDYPFPTGFNVPRLLDDPVLAAAVRDAVGGDATLLHTRWHSNAAGSRGLGLHQDGLDPHGRADCVRLWWFPQAVTPMNGPIWLAPASQDLPAEPRQPAAVPVLCAAGGFVIVAAGLWHWQGPNGSPDPRIMIRLEFARMQP